MFGWLERDRPAAAKAAPILGGDLGEGEVAVATSHVADGLDHARAIDGQDAGRVRKPVQEAGAAVVEDLGRLDGRAQHQRRDSQVGPAHAGKGQEGDGDADTLLYDKAVAVVTQTRRASISGVQRHLRIGYNRAARLVEQMEQDGVVSAPQHNGNREVLAPPPPKN